MNKAEAEMLAHLQRAYQGDAIFRPSAASRWMLPNGCPGSVQLTAKLPRVKQVSSAAARAGTAAHTLAQIVLTDPQGLAPEDFVGRYIQIDSHDPTDTHFVDEEMAEKVNEYIGIVDGYKATPGTEIFVEHKLTLGALDPANPLLNECRGTGDVVAVNRGQRWIINLDLKYGVGVPVAGNSPQLKIYLLMALLGFADGKPWSWGNTTVFQPRLPVPPYTEEDHYKAFIFQPDEILNDFLADVLVSMYAALAPNPSLNPSPTNCRWCPAGDAGICPALQTAGLNMARGAFEQQQPSMTASTQLTPFPPIVTDPKAAPLSNGKDVLFLRSIDQLSPDEIANVLNGIVMLEIYATGAKHRAAQFIESGIKVPGWYMKHRTGNRRWAVPREVVEAALLKLKLKPQEIYTDPKLKTPKQIEDVLSKLLKPAIAHLVERPPGAPTLVSGDEPATLETPLKIAMLTPFSP